MAIKIPDRMALSQTARHLYLQFVLIMGVGEIAAQDIVNMPDVAKRPTAQSTGLNTDPVIDGDVLQDEVWKAVMPIDQLWQTKPNAGFPASEKTEIRIGYTTTTF